MEGGKNPPSFIYGLTRLKSARTATAEAATRTATAEASAAETATAFTATATFTAARTTGASHVGHAAKEVEAVDDAQHAVGVDGVAPCVAAHRGIDGVALHERIVNLSVIGQ